MPRSGERFGRGDGSGSSVGPSGEHFNAKRAGQIVLGICFGYFHLCQQMKVTRPPAGTGALLQAAKKSQHRSSKTN
jgi:hypothetical protein